MKGKALSLVLLVVLSVTACGKSSPETSSNKVKLSVLAAARLQDVLPKVADMFSKDNPAVTFSFSFDIIDRVVARIEQGEAADVFAGSAAMFSDQLVAANKTDPYKVFATNPLVLITSTDNPAGITTLQDLATKQVRLLIVSDTNVISAPLTAMALTNLNAVFGSDYSATVLGKVVSREDEIPVLIQKIESGDADAGFVLNSDVQDAGANVNVIQLPAEAQAYAKFTIAVVKASKNSTAARQFVDFTLTAPAQTLLQQAGFGPALIPSP